MVSADNGMPRPFRGVIVDVHGTYHAQNIRHQPPDQLVDDVVTMRMLVPHLIRTGLFLLFSFWAFVIGVILGFAAVAASGFGFGGDPDPGLAGFGSFFNVIAWLLLITAIVLLFLPNKEPIGEYSMLLEGHAWTTPAAYSWVRAAAMARRTPFVNDPLLVSGIPVLVFTSGRVQAMLQVRPYGEDLFVGWTMWRARSTIVLIGNFLRDSFSWGSRRAQANAEVRASESRAMREIVHSLTREGVQAAIHATEAANDLGSTPEMLAGGIGQLPEINLGQPGGAQPSGRP